MSAALDAGMGNNSLRFQVVTKMDQLVHVFAIRAICYMEDAGMPADHSIDGNDLQATHIVAYSADEPVGALRIRWFKDFAKIERSAFRRSHRNPRYLRLAAQFVFNHIARKGYRLVVTHAEPQYAEVWKRILGFEQAPDKPAANYFGKPFVELFKELPIPENAITLDSSVAVLYRTEGEWDVPAKYEAPG
ncbi:MAG: hypothetical protein ABSD21_12755 [Rhizomicrobium sp.]|jgi:hypothetical protein